MTYRALLSVLSWSAAKEYQAEPRQLDTYAAQLSGSVPKGPWESTASLIHSAQNKTGLQICLLPMQ